MVDEIEIHLTTDVYRHSTIANQNTGEGIFGVKTAIATEQGPHKPGSLKRIVPPLSRFALSSKWETQP